MKPNRFKVTFESKQTAVVEVEAASPGEAEEKAMEMWLSDGLEGKWNSTDPRIKSTCRTGWSRHKKET